MHRARLRAIEALSPAVQRIALDVEGFRFTAGQYLVLHAGDQRIPLSIASAPARLPELELHYRSTPGDVAAAALDVLLAGAETLVFDGPHGDVTIRGAAAAALNLVAGGTGVAQAASLIEHLLSCRQVEPVRLIRSLAQPTDEYPVTAIARARGRAWFDELILVDDPTRPVNAAVVWIESRDALPGRWLLSGPPGFVYACADALRGRGVARSQIDADAFDYAPRSDWAAER